jgi:TonB family protein
VAAARPAEPGPPRPRGEAPGGGALSGGPFSLLGRGFSLLPPRLEAPPAPGGGEASGTGGARPEGDGSGEAGTSREGQQAVPLNTPDPRFAEYFLEIKRRIEAHLVYPREAARQGQSGQLRLEFVVRKDGSVRMVELMHSSGVGVLDRYSLNTVKLAAPFPPIPDRLGLDAVLISANFTYVLDSGFRLGGILR